MFMVNTDYINSLLGNTLGTGSDYRTIMDRDVTIKNDDDEINARLLISIDKDARLYFGLDRASHRMGASLADLEESDIDEMFVRIIDYKTNNLAKPSQVHSQNASQCHNLYTGIKRYQNIVGLLFKR
tara:strand:+ start:87053 stop:87433 length:381 start_codon:yes stop_codon:yes gene_type:complete